MLLAVARNWIQGFLAWAKYSISLSFFTSLNVCCPSPTTNQPSVMNIAQYCNKTTKEEQMQHSLVRISRQHLGIVRLAKNISDFQMYSVWRRMELEGSKKLICFIWSASFIEQNIYSKDLWSKLLRISLSNFCSVCFLVCCCCCMLLLLLPYMYKVNIWGSSDYASCSVQCIPVRWRFTPLDEKFSGYAKQSTNIELDIEIYSIKVIS